MASSTIIDHKYPERFFNTAPEDHDYIEAWLTRQGLDPDFHSWFINWCIRVADQHRNPRTDTSRPGYHFERQLLASLSHHRLDRSKYCHFMAYYLKSVNTGGHPIYTIIQRDADVEEKEAGQEELRRILHGGQGRRVRARRRRERALASREMGGASADQGPPEAEEEMEEEGEEVAALTTELEGLKGPSNEIGGNLPFRQK